MTSQEASTPHPVTPDTVGNLRQTKSFRPSELPLSLPPSTLQSFPGSKSCPSQYNFFECHENPEFHFTITCQFFCRSEGTAGCNNLSRSGGVTWSRPNQTSEIISVSQPWPERSDLPNVVMRGGTISWTFTHSIHLSERERERGRTNYQK